MRTKVKERLVADEQQGVHGCGGDSVGGKWAPSQSPASGEWLTDFWAGEWVANAASAGDWLLKL